MTSKTRINSCRLVYLSLAFAGLAVGILLSLYPKRLFIHPHTFFLQFMPVLGVLIAALAPEGLGRGAARILDKLKACPKTSLSIFVVLTASILIFINRSVLLSFMNSADENSCYFFAQCLTAEKWWVKPHELKDFFETAHIGALDGKWFSVYPPGWPLVWAAALKLNLKDVINPVITALSFIFLFDIAKKIYSASAFFLAAAILSISPFFLLNGAGYYSHNLCLFLMLAFWSCYLRWNETNSFKWAALCGLVLGYAFATRYLTAAALGFLPCLVQGIAALKKRGKAFSSFVAFGAAFSLLIAAQMFYNFKLTGNPVDPPNHYLHSHEKLGFIAGYPPKVALEYLGTRFLYLLDWTPPGWIYAFLAGCIAFKPKNANDLILRITVFMLPLAYVLYYSWGGNQYGPRYLFEAYPFLILSAAASLGEFWRREHPLAKTRVILFVLFSALASVPVTSRHLNFFREATAFRKATYDLIEKTVEKPALVFVSGFWGSEKLAMAPEDQARNSPFLDTPIVYALDKGAENAKLVPFFQGRHYYRATYDQSRNKPRVESLSL